MKMRVAEIGDNCIDVYERIGKKYQWIETYRLLARLDDNYPPFEIEHTYKKGYEAAKGAHFSFSKSLLSRLIESDISTE